MGYALRICELTSSCTTHHPRPRVVRPTRTGESSSPLSTVSPINPTHGRQSSKHLLTSREGCAHEANPGIQYSTFNLWLNLGDRLGLISKVVSMLHSASLMYNDRTPLVSFGHLTGTIAGWEEVQVTIKYFLPVAVHLTKGVSKSHTTSLRRS
jgi:hypothetical protein